MDEAQKNVSTAIFDITHACLQSFDQIVADHDGSLLAQRLVPFDGTASSSSQNPSTFDFLGLRNRFLFWIEDTGALSLMSSSLDAKLQGLEYISMVIQLLQMILWNLRRIDRKSGNASVVPPNLTKLHVHSELWEDASQAVEYALDWLRLISVAMRKTSFCSKPLEHAHSKDRLRKVRTTIWYCDIDHDVSETFETESEWRDHMRNLESHPKRDLKAPTQTQLDALSPQKQKVVLRDKLVCPLCEQVTNKI